MSNDFEYVNYHLKEGSSNYCEGKYDTALSYYKEAYICIGDGNLAISLKCKILLCLIKAAYRLNQIEENKNYLKEALSLMKDLKDKSLEHFKFKFYAEEGKVYIKEEKYGEGIALLKQIIEYRDLNIATEFILEIQSIIAKAYIAQYDYENAEKFLSTCLKQQMRKLKIAGAISKNILDANLTNGQRISDENLENTMMILNDSSDKNLSRTLKAALLFDTIGSIFYLHHNYSKAITCYKISDDIKSKTFKSKDNGNRLASAEYLSKAHFAYAKLDSRLLQAAAVYYKRWEAIIVRTKANDRILLAGINNKLGDIEFMKKMFKESRAYYVKAEENLSESEFNARSVIEKVNNYFGLAMVNLVESKVNLAEKYFKMCLNVANENLKQNEQILIADILEKIAEMYRQRNEITEAKEIYRAVLKFREEICTENDLDFARSYYSKGSLEKYRRKFNKRLSLDDQQLIEFKMIDKACSQKAMVYNEIARIHKFVEDDNLYLSYRNQALEELKNCERNQNKKKVIDDTPKKPPVSNSNKISNLSDQIRKHQQGK